MWEQLTKENVETICLTQAKSYARSLGYPDTVVFRCTCETVESGQDKSFTCIVGALDGTHELSITCNKTTQTCEIISEQGTRKLTFKDLESYLK